MMKKYLPIALVAVALVMVIPVVYGAVQPSVIINLESGQIPLGTKPFVIEDSLGNEVFSVSPSGSVRSTNQFVFEYEQKELVVLPLGSFELPLIKELAVWEIVQDPSFTAKHKDYSTLVIFDVSTNAVMKSLNTTCNCVRTGFYTSADSTFSETGMQWVFERATVPPSSVGVFAYDFDGTDFTGITSKPNFIAFGTSNLTPNKTGEVKEMSGTMTVHFPMGVSIVRVK